MKNCINCKNGAILQYKLNGTLVAEHASMKLGADSVGVHITSVYKATDTYKLNGRPRVAGGYVWKRK